jgi:hypothetical protein
MSLLRSDETVKILLPHFADYKDPLNRFVREAECLGAQSSLLKYAECRYETLPPM